jgi:hypothetical protein
VASHPPTDTKILKALSDPSQSQHPGQNLIPTVRDEFEVHGLRLCYLDLHLANVLLKFSTNIDVLSIDQLYEMYGKPETLPIIRSNGEPLPDTMPAHAVQSFFLGKSMDDLALPVHRHAVLQKPSSNPTSPTAIHLTSGVSLQRSGISSA